MSQPSKPLIAIQVGNSRIAFGRFDTVSQSGLPRPASTLAAPVDAWSEGLAAWLCEQREREHERAVFSRGAVEPSEGDKAEECRWILASVNSKTSAAIRHWLTSYGVDEVAGPLTFRDLPIRVELERPEQVGVDRLLAAVAVNRLRAADRPAISIDMGTAITVNLIGADGAFAGGSILPGLRMAAEALHRQTDQLPLVEQLEPPAPPPALGVSTRGAIQTGLIWGAVGALRELVHGLSVGLSAEPEVFITGGGAPSVVDLLGKPFRHEPHLVLSGMAIVGEEQ